MDRPNAHFDFTNAETSGFIQAENTAEHINIENQRNEPQGGAHQSNSYNPYTFIKQHKKGSEIVALVGIIALALVMGLRFGLNNDKSSDDKPVSTIDKTLQPHTKKSQTASNLSSSTGFSSSSDSVSSIQTSSLHPPISISTPVDPLSSFIESMTSMTSTTTPTPTQAPSTQPQPPTTVKTPTPTVLNPAASCTTDSQCTPNICYTEPTATYCCGSTIQGCPGWPCTDIGHTDCKDPFTCNFAASTCG